MESIRSRNLTRDAVESVVRWKFPDRRMASTPLKALSEEQWARTEGFLHEALESIVSSDDDDQPVAILDNIFGWGVPMASALVTVLHPDRFTVADGRARTVLRETTGFPDDGQWFFTQRDWKPYLNECRRVLTVLEKQGAGPDSRPWTLRQVDRGLWAAYESFRTR